MPARLSGSGIARASTCPPAYALPEVQGTSSDASRGTQVHGYLELVARGEPTQEYLDALPLDVRGWCARIDLREVPREGEPEVAVAYDVRSGRARLLHPTGHRAYGPLAPTEIPGSADHLRTVQTDAGPVLVVLDWKTARWDHDVETSRPQLEFYALAFSRAKKHAGGVRCEIGVITEDGAVAWHRWTLSQDDLMDVGARLKATVAAVERARQDRDEHELLHAAPWVPDVTEGAHCRYCPAWNACPAKRAVVGMVLGTDPEAISLEDLGRAHLMGLDARKAVERLKEVTHEAVRVHSEVPTGDGRVVSLDGRGALRVRRAS